MNKVTKENTLCSITCLNERFSIALEKLSNKRSELHALRMLILLITSAFAFPEFLIPAKAGSELAGSYILFCATKVLTNAEIFQCLLIFFPTTCCLYYLCRLETKLPQAKGPMANFLESVRAMVSFNIVVVGNTFGLLTSFVFFQGIFGSPLLAMLCGVAIVPPLFEETYKNEPVRAKMFGLVEFFGYVQGGTSVFLRIPALLLHWRTGHSENKKYDMFIHAIFNGTSVITVYYGMTTATVLLCTSLATTAAALASSLHKDDMEMYEFFKTWGLEGAICATGTPQSRFLQVVKFVLNKDPDDYRRAADMLASCFSAPVDEVRPSAGTVDACKRLGKFFRRDMSLDDALDNLELLVDDFMALNESAQSFHLSRILTVFAAYSYLNDTTITWARYVGLIDHHLKREIEEDKASIFTAVSVIRSAIALLKMILGKNSGITKIRNTEDFCNAVCFLQSNQFNIAEKYDNTAEDRATFAEYMRVFDMCLSWTPPVKKVNMGPPSAYDKLLPVHQKMFHEIKMYVNKENRKVQRSHINIGLYGGVKVGKSEFIFASLAAAAMRALKINVDPNDKTWYAQDVPGDEYMSSFQPGKTLAWIFDELGNMLPKHAALVAQKINGINGLIDGSQQVANRAGVEEKGAIVFNPRVIGLISNKDDFGLSQVYDDLAPSMRRFDITFKIIPKEEYRDSLGQLDVNKVGKGNYDTVHLRLMARYVTDGKSSFQEVLDPDGMPVDYDLVGAQALVYMKMALAESRSSLVGLAIENSLKCDVLKTETFDRVVEYQMSAILPTVNKLLEDHELDEFHLSNVHVYLDSFRRFSNYNTLTGYQFHDAMMSYFARVHKCIPEEDRIRGDGVLFDGEVVSWGEILDEDVSETVPSATIPKKVHEYVESVKEMRRRYIDENQTLNLYQWRYNLCLKIMFNRIAKVKMNIQNVAIQRALGARISRFLRMDGTVLDNEYDGLREMLFVSLRYQGIFMPLENYDEFTRYVVAARAKACSERNKKALAFVGSIFAASYASYKLYNHYTSDSDRVTVDGGTVSLRHPPVVHGKHAKGGKCNIDSVKSDVEPDVDVVRENSKEKEDAIVPSATELHEFFKGNKDLGPDNITGNPWKHEVGYVHNSPWSNLEHERFLAKMAQHVSIIEVGFPTSDGFGLLTTNAIISETVVITVWHALRHLELSGSFIRVKKTLFKPGYTDKHGTLHPPEYTVISEKKNSNVFNFVRRIGSTDIGIVMLPISPRKNLAKGFAAHVNLLGSFSKGKVANIFREKEGSQKIRTEHSTYRSFSDLKYTVPESAGLKEYTVKGTHGTFIGGARGFDGRCGSPVFAYDDKRINGIGLYVGDNYATRAHIFAPLSWADIEKAVDDVIRCNDWVPCAGLDLDERYENLPVFKDMNKKLMKPVASSRCTIHYLTAKELGVSEFLFRSDEIRSHRPSSKVQELPLYHNIIGTEEFEEFHHGRVRPTFSFKEIEGRRVNNRLVNQVQSNSPGGEVNLFHLQVVIEHLVEKLDVPDLVFVEFLSTYHAMSGHKDRGTCQSAPRDTSDGMLPVSGKKYMHLEPCSTDEAPDGVKLTEEFENRVNESWIRTQEGKFCGLVGISCDKDEPTKQSKIDECRERVFNNVSFVDYVKQKQLFGTLIAIACANFITFATMCGINPFGEEWDVVAKHMLKHPWGFNGDYRHFDKTELIDFIIGGLMIFRRLLELGFAKKKIPLPPCWGKAWRGTVSDLANPIMVDGKCVIRLQGTTFSGILITLFLNGIVNVMILMMSYLSTIDVDENMSEKRLRKALKVFDENTSYSTMGDDNMVTISDLFRDIWNFQHVRAYCDFIGMTFTPADKSDGKDYYYEPTVRPDGSCSFTICKREFRWDEERQRYACPLELKSIGKMLTIGLKSQLSATQQQEVNIQTAIYELAQHGREVFDEYCARFRLAAGPKYGKLFNVTYEDIITKIEGHDFFPWSSASEEESVEAINELNSGVIGSLYLTMKHGKSRVKKPSHDGKRGY